ncbi:MAG TPA: hypothetical protein VK469_21885 [Candidatus Kapabacteria bacterium]|nr:hypothetical protein [Candidatus Kapabacteria bacterium]
MSTEKKVISFERLSSVKKPESLKVSDMSKLKAGHYDRGSQAGSCGADYCFCGCATPPIE